MRIKAESLGRRFGSSDAVQNFSFECGPGEIIALIGNNGAGKTTLLQLLAGLLAPTQGSLLIEGKTLDRRDEALRQRIAFIPDFPPYFMGHTVLQHIAMVCSLHHLPEEGLEDLLFPLMDELGILSLGKSKIQTLSRGQIYKTVLAGTVLCKPDLWLLDEPMASGMDPQGLTFLRNHLRQAADAGAIVFYSTQIAETAERFSDRLFVIKDGRLLAQESAEKLMSRLQAPTLEEGLAKVFAHDCLT